MPESNPGDEDCSIFQAVQEADSDGTNYPFTHLQLAEVISVRTDR